MTIALVGRTMRYSQTTFYQVALYILLLATSFLLPCCAGPVEDRDSDNDGLTDLCEEQVFLTDPYDRDTDDDGILDGDEDHDGDGINNLTEEAQYLTYAGGRCYEREP